MDKESLRKLIEDDDMGLLAIKPVQNASQSPEERLIEKFYKIADFYRVHAREPQKDPNNMQEAQLAMSLEGIRNSHESIATLQALDEFKLLEPPVPPESLEDILADDDMGLLDDTASAESIFTLKHVPNKIDLPDFVAQRERCEDFECYKSLFKSCQNDLRSGKRQLLKFANEQQIQAGQFFVLKGIMAYVAEVGEKENKSGKVNARLRCIFENGTESAMLLRSLARELYKDGRRITEHEDHLIKEIQDITDEDTRTGYIYILRSLSNDPDITGILDLYKIGYSSGPVEERIKHAEQDPTYLMAPVKIITTFECYNLSISKFEDLIHKFFGHVCLEVDVFDTHGKRHTPREWFIAPLVVIEEAIRLIISGEILDYRYDQTDKLILRK